MQLLAVGLARARGLDPDRPRNLTRSVILAAVILVVCLNPALDITHDVAAVDWAGMNRPAAVHDRPGGKGLNVARTLHALGADVLVTGLAGGTTGAGVAAALDASRGARRLHPGLRARPGAPSPWSTARGGVAASFHEPGPGRQRGRVRRVPGPITGGRWPARDAVVLSGSLPPGLPAGTYAALIEVATAPGCPRCSTRTGRRCGWAPPPGPPS